MSGSDEVIFNNLERALSTDFNDLQSLISRSASVTSQFAALPYPQYNTAIKGMVIGGLRATAAGNVVSVEAGALISDGSSLVPSPGPLDSTYRIGLLRSTTAVSVPIPGSDTYYLIEAQPERVVTANSPRDIFNTITGIFSSSSVDKQAEWGITFNVKAGTSTSAPATTNGWVPLWIVFQVAGGGSLDDTDLWDVRPLTADAGAPPSPISRTQYAVNADPLLGQRSSPIIEFMASFQDSDGWKSFEGNANLSDTKWHEPGLVLTDRRRYYFYLCNAGEPSYGTVRKFIPWAGIPFPTPVPVYTGIPVLSQTPTDIGSRTPSAAIILPEPRQGIASTRGYCIGSALYNASLGGFTREYEDNHGFAGGTWERVTGPSEDNPEFPIELASMSAPTTFADINIDSITSFPTINTAIPTYARWLIMRIRSEAGAAGLCQLGIGPFGVVPTATNVYDKIVWRTEGGIHTNVTIPIHASRQFRLTGVSNQDIVLYAAGWRT